MEIQDAPDIDLIKQVKPEYLDDQTRAIYQGLKDLTNDFTTDLDIAADEISKLVSDIKKYFPPALYEHIDLGIIELSEEAKLELSRAPKFAPIAKEPHESVKEAEQETEVVEPLTDNDLIKGRSQEEINTMIRNLLADKGISREKYSVAEIEMLELYDPIEFTKEAEVPDEVARKMWGIAYKQGFSFGKNKNILDPSVRTGKFLKYIPSNNVGKTTFYEIEKNCWMISRILYPDFEIINRNFALAFYKDKNGDFKWLGLDGIKDRYDLVIGNPPHRQFKHEYGEEERKDTGAVMLDQYLLMRGVDLLKPGGLIVFLMPSDFMRSDDTALIKNSFKDSLMDKADIVDAYRLPDSIFNGKGMDIIALRKK